MSEDLATSAIQPKKQKQTEPPSVSERIKARQTRTDSLKQFLQEPDANRALFIWLTELSSGSSQYQNGQLQDFISCQIAAIDEKINDLLNAILHHPRFQQLESSWRGLWTLVDQSGQSRLTRVRLLDISWREVSKDIERAPDITQTTLFRLIYNEEFGMAGGEPYGILLGDYQVAHRSYPGHPYDDITTLQGLSQVAAASFAPFVCGAAPELFGLDSFDELGMPLNISNLFQQQEYIRWQSLRQSEDSRFLAITLPEVLCREPWDKTITLPRQDSLNFKENSREKGLSGYLWANACYAFGCNLLREFGDVGWFAHIKGVPRDYLGGGLVTCYQSQDYSTDSQGTAHKILTPVLITDTVERELSDLGLIALSHCHDTPYAAFHSCPSLHLSKKYKSKSATSNDRISGMLQQVLSASRFAHYIKIMIREKVGQFITAKECERYLQEWLNKYCTGREDLKWEMLARYPLREARVEVREQPGSAGAYHSTIYLRPHYSADHLVSELRLTTELASLNNH